MSRLVVVSNRVPVPSAGKAAGGLAVALDGLMEKRGGLWFGWSGKVSDDAAAQPVKVVHSAGVDYATVDLTSEEHDRYYNNFSNGVLWPLLHTMPELMHYDRQDARVYGDVNRRLAGALVPLLHPSDIVWVHDYHLLPMASALRAEGVRNPIGFFLHIPFASPDMLATAPELTEFVREMLKADLIGFQTENDLTNFATAAEMLAGASRALGNTLQVASQQGGSRRVRLGVFPVEIEPRSFARMASDMVASPPVESLLASLGNQRLMLGIERLDPTKGLPQRIAGFRVLLEERPGWRRNLTMLQIAASSRADVSSYRALRVTLDREAGALNADLGEADWTPLRFITRGVDRSIAAGFMRAAKVGVVTPLRDGMNLVAKEYVAAQDPENPGALVLSRFCGAARQLDAAIMVNPHDSHAMAEAMQTALTMSLAERQERWSSLWASIEHRSPLVWGRSFLTALLQAASVATTPDRVRAIPAPPQIARRVGAERAASGRLMGSLTGGGLVDVPAPRAVN